MMTSRKLGPGEVLMARGSEKTSNNFLLVVQYEGNLDLTKFETAFEQSSSLYPILGAKVVEHNRRLEIQFGASSQVKLTMIERRDSTHWQELAEAEMNVHLPATGSVLWRATLLHGDTGAELILTFNHLLGDGKSAVNFAQSLMSIYCGSPVPSPRKVHQSVNSLMKTSSLSLDRLRNVARFLQHTLTKKTQQIYTLPPVGQLEKGVYGTTGLISESLDAKLMTSLHNQARIHKTTVHGVICAALLLAIREYSEKPQQHLGVASAVNLRPQLAGDYGPDFGFFVGSIEHVRTVHDASEIWPLAASLSQALKDDIMGERPLIEAYLRGLLLKKYPDFDEAAAVMRSRSQSTVHVTNLGRIEWPVQDGPVRVKHCFHVPSCHFLSRPYLVLACVTMNDVMMMNFTFPLPFVSRAEAARIIQLFHATIRRVSLES